MSLDDIKLQTVDKPKKTISNNQTTNLNNRLHYIQKLCKGKFTLNRQKLMSFCAENIAFLHPICAYSVYLMYHMY